MLLAWYRMKFNVDNPYQLLWSWQKYFNSIGVVRCRGMRFMKDLKRGRHQCGHPLCPTCWHQKQGFFLETLQDAVSLPVYERSVGPYLWSTLPEDNALKRLKARSTRFRLLGWSMCFDAAEQQITLASQRNDIFAGELFYFIRGMFTCDTPVREYRSESAGSYRFQDIVRILRVPDADTAASHWLDGLHHPFEFHRHSLFAEYVRWFRNAYPTGRSWMHINRQKTLDSVSEPIANKSL